MQVDDTAKSLAPLAYIGSPLLLQEVTVIQLHEDHKISSAYQLRDGRANAHYRYQTPRRR
jgi:hypothetical protein